MEISTNQLKNGNHIEVDNQFFRVMDFQHVKPGKGPAFVRTKLKRIADGATLDKTFRAGEKFRLIRTEVETVQYLYRDGTDAHFMNSASYEQLTLPETQLAEALKWISENDEVTLLYMDGKANDIQLPGTVELEIAHTDPGLRGDTVSGGGNKLATLSSGADIKVPLFINTGDRVKIDTKSGEYLGRV